MKKLFSIIACVCALTSTAMAQQENQQVNQQMNDSAIQKKVWQGDIAKKWEFRGRIGGFYGYSNHHQWRDTKKNYHQDDLYGAFEAGLGYNINNNWYIGAEGGFWWSSYPFYGVKAGDAAGVNGVISYRFFKNDKRWHWFIQARGGYMWATSGKRTVPVSMEEGYVTGKTPKTRNLEIMPGVNFRLRENIDLVVGVGYQHMFNTKSPVAYKHENGIIMKVGINIRRKSKEEQPVATYAPVVTPDTIVNKEPIVIHDTVVVKETVVEKDTVVKTVTEVVKEPVVEKVTVEKPVVDNVFFLVNRWDIRPTEMKKVEHMVEVLNQYPGATLNLVGCADKNTGTPAINEKLSRNRVNSVYNELIKRGIDPSRLTRDYKGDTYQPYASDEANYQKNRCTTCVIK